MTDQDSGILETTGFTEAPACVNAHFLDARGNKIQVTLRDGTENKLIDRWVSLNQKLDKLGIKPLYNMDAEPATPDRIAAGSKSNGSEKSFVVESVKLAAGGDHPRWVIKGKPFTRFGVTCWPETLEAAGMMPHLDPLKDNKPQATWTAFYQEKQNDEGKWVPDKVTRLVKA